MMRSRSGGTSGFRRKAAGGEESRMDLKISAELPPAKWKRAGGHLVEDGAERKQVAAGVEFLSASLFRRHVGNGAESRAGAGEVLVLKRGHGIGRCDLAGRSGHCRDLGEAEV